MLLINKAARCIDLRNKKGEKFRLLPAGDAVEVPADVCKREFVQNLIDSGDIAEVKATPKAAKVSE